MFDIVIPINPNRTKQSKNDVGIENPTSNAALVPSDVSTTIITKAIAVKTDPSNCLTILSTIAGIMLFWFDYLYLSVIVVMIAAYIWFTFKVTEWRVKIRKFMNDQDTDANQKAIDSLLNYETVKYFSAEEREAKRYDGAIKLYEKAALTTAYSLAFLNFGQSLIITAGLIIVMVMAALGVQSGHLTVGDFVMVNADEFFEVLTWAQLEVHKKPIVVINVENYWDPLFSLIDHTISKGFADSSLKKMFKVTETAKEAVEYLIRLNQGNSLSRVNFE